MQKNGKVNMNHPLIIILVYASKINVSDVKLSSPVKCREYSYKRCKFIISIEVPKKYLIFHFFIIKKNNPKLEPIIAWSSPNDIKSQR